MCKIPILKIVIQVTLHCKDLIAFSKRKLNLDHCQRLTLLDSWLEGVFITPYMKIFCKMIQLKAKLRV